MEPAPGARPRTPLWLLVGLQTGISAAGLVVEIVAARMVAPYVGMSLYSWTAIIAVVLAGFSIGHWWGGRMAALPSARAFVRTGWTLLAAAVVTAAAGLVLRWTAGPVLERVENPMAAITLVVALAFFLPSLFAGVPAPVLAVVAMRDQSRSEHALGVMFAAGAAGAIAGTLLAGFLFISWLGSVATLAVIAGFYAAAAVVCLRLGGLERRTGAVAALGLAAALALGLRALSLPAICDVESSYYCIRTVDLSETSAEPVHLMVLDHLAHGVSGGRSAELMMTDHSAMLDALPRMRMGERAFSSFHIGGGSYSVIRAWAERGMTQITVAEIDPAVTRQAVRDFWFVPESATVLHQDARTALRTSPRSFDVVVGDAFTDIAAPPHLVTREFFQLVADRLTPEGVYVMNVADNVDRLAALSALYLTLSAVFPSVEVWTEARPPAPGERRIFVLVAGAEDSHVSAIAAPAPEMKHFAPLERAYLDELLARIRPPVLTDDYAPIDRLMGLDPLLD